MIQRRRRIRRTFSLADCVAHFPDFPPNSLIDSGAGKDRRAGMFARAAPRIGGDFSNREDRAFGTCNTSQKKPVCPAQKILQISPKAWLVGMEIVVWTVYEDNLMQQESRICIQASAAQLLFLLP